jgi:hypothetical protein
VTELPETRYAKTPDGVHILRERGRGIGLRRRAALVVGSGIDFEGRGGHVWWPLAARDRIRPVCRRDY